MRLTPTSRTMLSIADSLEGRGATVAVVLAARAPFELLARLGYQVHADAEVLGGGKLAGRFDL